MSAGRSHQTLFVAVKPVGDRFIEHGPEATIGGLAGALASGRVGIGVGRTVRVERTGSVLPPEQLLVEADIRNGDELTLLGPEGAPATTGDGTERDGPATLRINSGPLAGSTFPLRHGENAVGRLSSNDVVILDAGVSRHHAIITVDSESVTVLDQQSTNGVAIDGRAITEPTEVPSGTQMILGHIWISIDHHPPVDPLAPGTRPEVHSEYAPQADSESAPQRDSAAAPPSGPLEPVPPTAGRRERHHGQTIDLPTPPDQTNKRRASDLLSPGRSPYRLAVEQFHADVEAAEARLRDAGERELTCRLDEAPSIGRLLAGAGTGDRLWERRASDPGGLEVRLGLGDVPSRTTVQLPSGGDPELRMLLAPIPGRHRTLSGAPVVADFRLLGSVGLGGTIDVVNRLAYALIAQLAWLHGPDQLGIAHRPHPGSGSWDWLKWLPHVDFAGAHNGIVDSEFVAWVAALLDGAPPASAVASANRESGPVPAVSDHRPSRPAAIVLVLDREGSLPTALMARLVQEGPALGVYSLLLGHNEYDRGVSPGGVVMVGPEYATLKHGFDGAGPDITVESIDLEAVTALARRLTPVRSTTGGGPSKMIAIGRPIPADGLVVGPFALGLPDPLGAATVVPPTGDEQAATAPEPPRPPRHQSTSSEPPHSASTDRGPSSAAPRPGPSSGRRGPPRSPIRRRDLKSLPHGDDDSRLVLGTVHGGDRSTVAVFACNLRRDGSLCVTGDHGFGKTSALRSIASAAALLRVAPDRLPMTYYLDVRGDLDGIGVLPHTVGASRNDIDGFRRVVADLERLITDRAAGFAQADVETFDDYRQLAPQSALRRAIVLVDEVDAFIELMDSLHPGRGLALLEQLAEHGTRFGVHLVASAVDRRDVTPSLAERLGRWLQLGSAGADGARRPGTASVGRAVVQFATIGGARASHRALVELADQLVERGVTPAAG